MKTLKETVLYFHDFMTTEEETAEEIRAFQRKFYNNGIEILEIQEIDEPPFRYHRSYDILLFDWGGASLGNSCMRHYCEYILEEALEKPSRIYIMVSSFTREAMREASESFKQANGEVPANVFMTIEEACKLLKEL